MPFVTSAAAAASTTLAPVLGGGGGGPVKAATVLLFLCTLGGLIMVGRFAFGRALRAGASAALSLSWAGAVVDG